jgi:hypothetical protein
MKLLNSSNTLWEIGNPTSKNLDFHKHAFSQNDAHPIFVVGESNPHTDWPFLHPGPLNASTNFRELSASVRFNLAINPTTVGYVLELEAREVSGPCPDLRITINGQAGFFFPAPIRNNRSHGPTVPSPTAGLISRTLRIPKDLVKEGDNEITFTTVCARSIENEELKPSMRPDLGWLFGSALGWERLAFIDISEEDHLPAERIKVELSPLYIENSHGSTDEIVEIVVENMSERSMFEASLHVGDYFNEIKYEELKHRFGDFRFQERIPESKGLQKVMVEIKSDHELLKFSDDLTPARQWTVHLIPHVHLDIGYTDVQAKVIEVHNRNIDKVLDILKVRSDYAFSIDGSFSVETYLNSRDQRRGRELIDALQKGQVSVNAIWALIFSGIPGLEDFYRSLYFAAELRTKHGIPIEYANLTDVPSYSASVPSILVHSGIDTFVGISNHTRGGNADSDVLHLISPVKWTGFDGSSVLAYFSDHYSQLRLVCGDPPTIAGVAQGLVTFLRRYEREDYLPNHFPLVGTHSDNEDLSDGYADFVERWNARYKWPRMKFSTMAGYLASVRPLLDELPEIVGDGGSYWEDGIGTQAVAAAVHRRTQTLLLGAEVISVLAATNTPGAVPDLKNLDASWKSILIGEEHTWTWAHTASHPHSRQTADQLNWKLGWIDRGYRLAVDETRRAMSQLLELINAKSLPSILIFNPSSWERDLYFDFEIKDRHLITDHDLNIAEQYQIGEIVDGLKIVKVRIPKVPPYGYELLPVIEIDSSQKIIKEYERSRSQSIENDYYIVEIDEQSGTLGSLFHKELGRMILAPRSEFDFGDVLYVSGGGSAHGRGLGSEKSSIYDYPPDLPPVSLDIECAQMSFVEATRTPWSWVIISKGVGQTLLNIQREFEIFDHTDEIQVRISFTKEPNLAKESVYVAFPFNLVKPEVHYDRQIGWITPKKDHLAGACNEWFTIQNSVILSGEDYSIAWSSSDAPLFTISDIVRGTWATSFETSNGTIFSWVMNNYWMTNTPAQQGGDITLNYSFRPSQEKNFILAGRLGRELRHRPLVSDLLHTDRGDAHVRPFDSVGSLWKVNLPDNVNLTVLPSRNGGKITVRIQEIAGKSIHFELPSPLTSTGLDNIWVASCLATEEILEYLPLHSSGEISVNLTPWAVKTYTFGTRKE